ncbi:MAG: SDR family oxidoreductase [Phycisphaerales bacterium]|nr:SDR family oxidoreductase [Phycisphaerales bacterium]
MSVDCAIQNWIDALWVQASYLHQSFNPEYDGSYILVTGSTGNIGSYLLNELISIKQPLILIVRKESQLLNINTEHSHIKQFIGDLTKPQLGLADHDWDFLLRHVKGIIHAGAWVNHIRSFEQLRTVNVTGILHLAPILLQQKKPFFTLLSTRYHDFLTEDLPAEEPLLDYQNRIGYIFTKYVAEQLTIRLFKGKVYFQLLRIGHTLLDSQFQIRKDRAKNHLISFFRACMDCKLMPDTFDSMHIFPVDLLAKTIISLSLHLPTQGADYHVCNLLHPYPLTSAQFIRQVYAYNKTEIKVCSYKEWDVAVQQLPQEHPYAVFRNQIYNNPTHIATKNTYDIFDSLGVHPAPLPVDYIDHLIDFAKKIN